MKSPDPEFQAAPMAWLVFLLGLLLVLIGVTVAVSLFCFSIVSEGIDAQLMTFESEPAQGWDYWVLKHQKEAIKSWTIPMLLAAGTLFLLLQLCWKTLRSIVAKVTSHQVERGTA
ncbi:hypothetical protein N9972_01235 [bacterium]|nr:hypothetical protein [Akkermansiaceae bacterium]MDB4288158.1 hypothetical protein [bacterium]MDA7674850.1 hypothetical protein [Akkermansiaceae bacterium]MDA7876641.1 hypothetical protein [Akkermansiaceae bacterium]MDA7931492.1 hypothetical protein [Akkermansiaceae bacterium]